MRVVEYRIGDALELKLVGNLLNGENPHLYTIDGIDIKNNCYHVRNLQTQEVQLYSRQNIDLYFIFKGHTR